MDVVSGLVATGIEISKCQKKYIADSTQEHIHLVHVSVDQRRSHLWKLRQELGIVYFVSRAPELYFRAFKITRDCA
jgi:hypothetical protein